MSLYRQPPLFDEQRCETGSSGYGTRTFAPRRRRHDTLSCCQIAAGGGVEETPARGGSGYSANRDHVRFVPRRAALNRSAVEELTVARQTTESDVRLALSANFEAAKPALGDRRAAKQFARHDGLPRLATASVVIAHPLSASLAQMVPVMVREHRFRHDLPPCTARNRTCGRQLPDATVGHNDIRGDSNVT